MAISPAHDAVNLHLSEAELLRRHIVIGYNSHIPGTYLIKVHRHALCRVRLCIHSGHLAIGHSVRGYIHAPCVIVGCIGHHIHRADGAAFAQIDQGVELAEGAVGPGVVGQNTVGDAGSYLQRITAGLIAFLRIDPGILSGSHIGLFHHNRNRLCLLISADRAGIGLDALCGLGCRGGDHAVIKGMRLFIHKLAAFAADHPVVVGIGLPIANGVLVRRFCTHLAVDRYLPEAELLRCHIVVGHHLYIAGSHRIKGNSNAIDRMLDRFDRSNLCIGHIVFGYIHAPCVPIRSIGNYIYFPDRA